MELHYIFFSPNVFVLLLAVSVVAGAQVKCSQAKWKTNFDLCLDSAFNRVWRHPTEG